MPTGPELSVVVPTFNEAGNIQPLVDLLASTLTDTHWEVIFVDDHSPDNTSAKVRSIARADSRVRCLERIERRGLSSAVIEGILATSAPYVCVMDADLQHDEKLLPQMLIELEAEHDLVVASRYIENASTGSLPEHRVRISRAATVLGNMILEHELSDPMSGFFMFKRELFEQVAPRLSGKGFKILLDIVANSPTGTRIKELPYHMKKREHGESKLSAVVVWEFFSLLANRMFGKYLPLRFIMFVSVGLSGVVVHTLVLYLIHIMLSYEFVFGQTIATLVAMTSNYFLNNLLTFNDSRHKGARMFLGLFSFYLTCSLGALINIAVATAIYNFGTVWWVAGICGAVVGAVWNFALSSTFTWRQIKTD